jgi:hypothetical protein
MFRIKSNPPEMYSLSTAEEILSGDIFTFGLPALPDWLRHQRIAIRRYSFTAASLLSYESGFVSRRLACLFAPHNPG